MTLGLIVLLALLILIFFSIPQWPYSVNWGYYPSGGLVVVMLILMVLMAMGRI